MCVCEREELVTRMARKRERLIPFQRSHNVRQICECEKMRDPPGAQIGELPPARKLARPKRTLLAVGTQASSIRYK